MEISFSGFQNVTIIDSIFRQSQLIYFYPVFLRHTSNFETMNRHIELVHLEFLRFTL